MSEDKTQDELKELFFSIYYDAEDEDLVNHRLPADRVAGAIAQMHTLVSQADKTLNGKDSSMELFVSAPAEQGSLGIEFFAELINPENAQMVLQFLGVSAFVGGLARGLLTDKDVDEQPEQENVCQTVFDAAQHINGSTVVDVETSDKSDVAVLKLDDREIKCQEEVARLVANPKIRTALHGLITKPIEGYKKPSIIIGNEGKSVPVTQLGSSEIKKIEHLLVAENQPKQHNMKATVTFTKINFESNKGWRIKLNDRQVDVTIADESFIKRINSNSQKFVKSDEYDVELTRLTTYNAVGKERVSYTLTKAKKRAKLK